MRCLKGILRGDTLELTYELPIAVGSLLSGIRSEVRQEPVAPATIGELVDEFTVTSLTPTATHSRWTLYVGPASTLVWPLGTLFWDIMHLSTGGDVMHSERMSMQIGEAVTQP